MPLLHVRNVPSELYKKIRAQARAARRSLSAPVLVLLDQAMQRADGEQESATAVLARLRARRNAITVPKDWPGSLQLLREDRDR